MSRKILEVARTRALAVSTLSAVEAVDRATADAAIRTTVRIHGGTGGCAAALAQQYGDCPELAARRVRWALQRVAALYPVTPPVRPHLVEPRGGSRQAQITVQCDRAAGLPVGSLAA